MNAELLIDHAWGYEPCTMADVKAYRPENTSLSSGQVLQRPYAYNEAKLIVREMTDLLVLDLVDKGLVCDSVVLTLNYDAVNLTDPDRRKEYRGKIVLDRYGRETPEHSHGTAALGGHTSSTRKIIDAMMELFDRVADPSLLVRHVVVAACNTLPETDAMDDPLTPEYEQLDLFTDHEAVEKERDDERIKREKEKSIQHAVLDIKKKYGKNAIIMGMNLKEGAMTIERNRQVGGHKA